RLLPRHRSCDVRAAASVRRSSMRDRRVHRRPAYRWRSRSCTRIDASSTASVCEPQLPCYVAGLVLSSGALVALIIGLATLVLVAFGVIARTSAAPKPGRVCGGCRCVMLPHWTKCLRCGWIPIARLEFILGPMANQTLALTD